jgi:hypothetical protein
MQAKQKSTPFLASPAHWLSRYLATPQCRSTGSRHLFVNPLLSLKEFEFELMQILSSEFPVIVDLFKSAKKQIIISTPGISEVVAEALISSKNEDGISIKVYLDLSEKSFRHGFGEISAITKLRENNIEYFSKEGLNLYFIIIDDAGYFYFPKSLFVEEEGTAKDLFAMTKHQVKTINLLYNNLDKSDTEYETIVKEVGIDTLLEVSKKIVPVAKEHSISLETKIKKDPPVKPDYERKLDTYKAKFQFVELKFSGANLHIKKVKLPQNALPFKDDDLKRTIEANLRILNDIPEKDFLKPFFDIKLNLDSIRNKYIYYIKKREKNIVKRDDKEAFEKELDLVKKDIEKVKTQIVNNLQEEIKKSRVRIKNNLFDFMKDNPPEEFEGLEGETLLDEIENTTNKIISAVRFPRAKTLLSGLQLEWHYYDITWLDLNNDEVLQEMQKHKLITTKQKSYFDELAIGIDKKQ